MVALRLTFCSPLKQRCCQVVASSKPADSKATLGTTKMQRRVNRRLKVSYMTCHPELRYLTYSLYSQMTSRWSKNLEMSFNLLPIGQM